jgi:hypothetical protein
MYDDKHNMRGLLARFWSKVATVFKGKRGVLGYELINEPWAGDVYVSSLLLTFRLTLARLISITI